MAALIASIRLSLIIMLTLVLLPLQAMALRLNGSIRRNLPHFYHRALLKIMGIRLKTYGVAPAQGQGRLIVANHLSWLDIVVISAAAPVSFIAKSEVGTWPAVSTLAKLQRTVFVNRTRRSKTKDVALSIKERITRGDHMVLFAEGTSGDGHRILPFKPALLAAAEGANSNHERQEPPSILPLTLAYTRWAGLPIGRAHRHRYAWYGDMDLAPHLWALMKTPYLEASVCWGAPLPETVTDRKEQSRALHKAISKQYAEMIHHAEPLQQNTSKAKESPSEQAVK
jgi:lyso-ornithine lipid O-acyltransferase